MNEKEYYVNQALPNNGQKVLCFGHHTHCCKEDMDEQPAWHEATFQFIVGEYRLKKEIPADPEESILDYYKISEDWSCGPEFTDGFVIGVIKWKKK
jgi:hypothetical protein